MVKGISYIRHIVTEIYKPTLLKRVLVGGQEILPAGRLQSNTFEQVQTLSQISSSVVAWLLDKQVILKHLIGQRLGEEALICSCVDRDETRRLARHFLEFGDDARRGIVVSCGKDLLTQGLGLIADGRNDKFPFGPED